MGSAYHMALGAKAFIQSLFPDMEVLALQPVEIDDIHRTFVPENDLAGLRIELGIHGVVAHALQPLQQGLRPPPELLAMLQTKYHHDRNY